MLKLGYQNDYVVAVNEFGRTVHFIRPMPDIETVLQASGLVPSWQATFNAFEAELDVRGSYGFWFGLLNSLDGGVQ